MSTFRRTARSVLAVTLFLAAPAWGQAVPRGNAGVRGTISDPNGRPLPGALVIRDGSSDTARADSAGRFVVERLALGRHVFRVTHPGYATMEFEAQFERDTTVSVDIPLERGSGGVSAAGTGGAAGKLELVGFTARRRAAEGSRGGATFLGPEDLAGRRGGRVSQLFEGVRDVTIRPGRDNAIILYGHDRRCLMNIWVEGQRLDNVFPPSETYSAAASRRGAGTRYPGLDEVVPADRILAIEVYPRPSQTPPQFQSSMRLSSGLETQDSGNCGSVVIWVID